MKISARTTLALIVQLIYSVKLSCASHYCEWSTCDIWQYCCRDNECCTKTDTSCYVEIGAGVAFGLLFLFWAIYSLRRYSSRTGRSILHLVFGKCLAFSRRRESSAANLVVCDAENDERALDPPPPYSEVMRVK